jgi:uncharacterized protein YlzI (FlbEa/FlbD family)
MSRFNQRYDEIKGLVSRARLINEQLNAEKLGPLNVGYDIEARISDNEYEVAVDPNKEKEAPEDYVQRYRISGSILAIHGPTKSATEITSDDKLAFQDTIDEFNEQVSDLVDYNQLNVYPNDVEWSGKIVDKDIEFIYTVGETSGTYINGNMVKVDDETLETIKKLKNFYDKFKSKWSRVLVSRKQLQDNDEDQ